MIDRALFELPGFRRALGVMAVASLLTALAVIGQAWTLSTALTSLWYGAALSDQAALIAAFACCFILRQVVANAQGRWLDGYASARADELRTGALERLFAEGQSLVQRQGTGSLTALVLEGVDQVESYLRLILPKMAAIVIIPVMLLAVIFPLDWVTGIIAVLVFPAIILQMVLIGSTARLQASVQYGEFQRLSNHFIDSVRGIDTLKLFGRGQAHGARIFEASERFRAATMRTLRTATLSGAVLDIFATLAVAACAVMLGFRLVDGSIVLFPALCALVLLPEYFRPIREFASDYHASLDGKNALAGLQELIRGNGDFCPLKAPNFVTGAAEEPAPRASIPAWTADAALELRDVSFSYGEGAALEGVTFEARGFAKVGVIGPSGGGKTTLVNLLAGFAAPAAGEITAGGVAVPSLERADWRSQVAYIPQHPYLFHATLRENVAFYRPDASEVEIEQAVRTVGLDELVEELPDGLDTLIGEGARALSGGQAQRIALARALLDEGRRIWLFDEPTAHLDIETEMELKERMLPLMEGRLVFFATHRLHWMHDMDQVLVMEGGRLVESGSYADLAAREGAFAHFAERVRGGERA